MAVLENVTVHAKYKKFMLCLSSVEVWIVTSMCNPNPPWMPAASKVIRNCAKKKKKKPNSICKLYNHDQQLSISYSCLHSCSLHLHNVPRWQYSGDHREGNPQQLLTVYLSPSFTNKSSSQAIRTIGRPLPVVTPFSQHLVLRTSKIAQKSDPPGQPRSERTQQWFRFAIYALFNARK